MDPMLRTLRDIQADFERNPDIHINPSLLSFSEERVRAVLGEDCSLMLLVKTLGLYTEAFDLGKEFEVRNPR